MTDRPTLTPREFVVAWLKAVLFILFLGGTAFLVVYYHEYFWRVFAQRHEFKAWVLQWGFWAPIVFVALQIFQIVVFLVPGEVVQSGGGYLFGPWLGALYCVIGAVIGSAISFFIADFLGRPLVKLVVKPHQFERLEKGINSRKGLGTVLLLFLIPGLPKDVVCYVAGMTPMHFGWFLLISTLGRIPGILISTFLGDMVADARYTQFVILCAVAFVALLLGLLFRRRIESWIYRRRADED